MGRYERRNRHEGVRPLPAGTKVRHQAQFQGEATAIVLAHFYVSGWLEYIVRPVSARARQQGRFAPKPLNTQWSANWVVVVSQSGERRATDEVRV